MPKRKSISLQQQRCNFADNMRYLHDVFSRYDKKNVIGIDPSLNHTAIAVQRIRKKKLRVFNSPESIRDLKDKKSVTCRISLTREFLIKYVNKYPPLLVAIEGYAYSRPQNREILGEVGGMIRLDVFWDHPKQVGPVIVVGTTQLKKYILGSAAAGGGVKTKQLIIMNVFKKWGIEVSNDNEADAIVLAKMAQDFIKFVDKFHNVIPSDDKELRKFINKGWEEHGYKKYQWEIMCSLTTNKGNRQLFDYCSVGAI